MASDHRKALWGWLSYAFASEVFAVCSLTLFLPICLEQFARDNGYLLPDKNIPCTTLGSLDESDARCVVKLGWLWIDSASYSLYVYSASVAIQALTVISLGGIADDPRHRKQLLLLFAALGSCSSFIFLILPSSSAIWPLSALLAIVANVCFGTSVVSLNSYLPQLARNEEVVLDALNDLKTERPPQNGHFDENTHEEVSVDQDHDSDERAPLRPESVEAQAALERYNEVLSRTTSRISSRGIAIGYTAGIILLLIILIPVTYLKGSTFSLRLAIGLTGAWWALFTFPAALWLPSGPIRAPVDNEEVGEVPVSLVKRSMGRQIIDAWRKLGHMLSPREIIKLRNTFWFLFAWFLLSDGFTTITSTAILFAKTTLHMPASSLIIIGALTPSAGILGAILWPIAQRRFNLSNLHALVVLVVLALVIPAYGCLGFLPIFRGDKAPSAPESIRSVKFGGLTTPGEMFVLAVYFGSLYGAFQSYARAVFSELIPPGEEARWFGLFSITDKSSSFVGPLIVGLIADTTGNIRYAFFFLVVMISLPIPVLLRKVDMAQGRKDAIHYADR